MKSRNFAALAALLLCMLWSALAQAAPFTFTFGALPSSGAVTGLPGQTVGWGYALVNTDTLNWFVPTQLSASSFNTGTPDASYFDFPVLAPGASISTAFDAVAHAGLYGLDLYPFVTATQSDSGQFSLSGEWWSGDPLAGGVFLQAADALLAPLSVEIGIAAIPLPGSLPLLALGLSLLALQWHGARTGQRRGDKGA